jgi:iron complex outermembrane recepter protein
MLNIEFSRASARGGLTAILLGSSALFATAALAATSDTSSIETVVVTGTRFDPDVAPAKARLETTQPQTIIQKSYIEDSIAPTADYVTILSIVPSLSGLSINGPGLSDGNVKNTLRGLQDGNFGLSYDGIPFGDTNGPTHHSESYFPSSTIGGADVDRGPGNAGTLGASTYGGTIKLFSEALDDDFHIRQSATAGSWTTFNFNTNVQSGAFDVLGHETRALVNYQVSGSSGYLTLQSTHRENELVKLSTELSPDWTLTFFGSRNGLSQIVNDNNGATAAQVANFGKNYALQNTDPRLPTYAYYNPEHKDTDMEYLRLQGTVLDGLTFDDEAYTYAYVNKTVTTADVTQTQAEILASSGAGAGPIANGLGTKVGGVSFANDVQGYTKLNAYRVWGNIARVSWDYDFGAVSGQIRAGVWSEWQGTERQRFYLDITKCAAANGGRCPGFDVEHTGLFADQKTSNGTVFGGVAGVGYIEHTGWSQYQPFIEMDIKPIEDLTITPGVKYVWWDHTINANSLVKGKPPTIYGATTPANPDDFVTTRTLPFATVNYRLQKSWSVYAQYANGIYVPDITAFEVNTPILTFPKPQTTTNYQFGTVLYGDNFSFDADVYYIDSDNTIGQDKCSNLTPPGPASDTCNYNEGKVTYKGIEAEGSYAFDGMLDGLSLFANGSLNSAKVHTKPLDPKSPTVQDAAAPFWTAAGGLIYKADGWKISLIDKLTGNQYADAATKRLSDYVAGQAFYRLGAYNKMDLTMYYDLGDFTHTGADVEIGGGVYNLLGDRSLVSVKTGSGGLGGTSVQDFMNRPLSTDQYYFMPERSFQFTLKARL